MFRKHTVESEPAQAESRRRAIRRRQANERDPQTTVHPGREQAVAPRWRTRGSLVVRGLILALARLIRFAAMAVALVVGLAILLRLLDANAGNSLVSAVHDAGRALVGPFDGMFRLRHAKAAMAVNWGIALVVYLAAGSLIAGYLRRIAVAGRRAGRRGLTTRTA
jgi:hypothetical protein